MESVLDDYKKTYPDAKPVAGYPYPAVAGSKVFVAQSDSRVCDVSTLVTAPPNTDAFVARSGELCKKVLG